MMENKFATKCLLLAIIATLSACQHNAGDKQADVLTSTYAKDQAMLQTVAEDSRKALAGLSFEEFEAGVYKEPFSGGKYIVNGDTTIANSKLLREFFESNVRKKPMAVSSQTEANDVPEFIIHTVGGLDAVWSSVQKKSLSYCVSIDFGVHHTSVVNDMLAATLAWESVADIDFIYLEDENERCNASNNAVVFDVRPVNVSGQYLARAFFPNESRPGRNVLIDNSSFELAPTQNLSLVGILRHEVGHVIGARHEHTRPDSGECFEDQNWRPITNYDAFSVMHYPHCNGQGDWKLSLTQGDKNGVACVYGAADGFSVDPTVCSSPAVSDEIDPVVGVQRSLSFEGETINLGEEKRYQTLSVVPGTEFTAEISRFGIAPSDPDLYLSFDATPQQVVTFDCRPFLAGANESCDVVVPNGVSIARIMVHGFAAGRYNLNVNYTAPAE